MARISNVWACNPQVHLAPLAPILGPVFLALPLPFAQELDSGAVHQQVQRRGAGLIGQLHPQFFSASAHGAEVRHLPIQAGQAQQASTKPRLWRRAKPNRHLTLRQNWMAASEKTRCRPRDHWPGRTTACLCPTKSSATLAPSAPRCKRRPVGGLVATFDSLGFTDAQPITSPLRLCATKPRAFIAASVPPCS